MRDSLKEHIEANSEDFEIYPFEGNDWNKIANKLDPPKAKYKGLAFGIAASLAVILITSVLVSNPSISTENEVAEIEGFYKKEIDQKVTLVRSQIGDAPILEDLEEMDQIFAELKADLDENVDNEEVISAMMDNYRLKLQILEEILTELEKEKSAEEVL